MPKELNRGDKVKVWDNYPDIYAIGYFVSFSDVCGRKYIKVCNDKDLQSETKKYLNYKRLEK